MRQLGRHGDWLHRVPSVLVSAKGAAAWTLDSASSGHGEREPASSMETAELAESLAGQINDAIRSNVRRRLRRAGLCLNQEADSHHKIMRFIT